MTTWNQGCFKTAGTDQGIISTIYLPLGAVLTSEKAFFRHIAIVGIKRSQI
jgi:isochorismate hydrolase